MGNHKSTIRRKVRRLMLIMAASALLITSMVGIFGMLNIRNAALDGGQSLGNNAAQKSAEALLVQMRQNMANIVKDKAQFAQAELNKYADFVESYARYAGALYDDPDGYSQRPADVPPLEGGELVMQRYLENEEVKLEDVWDEMCLLGNLEDVFSPAMERYQDVMFSVYIGTETGLMLTYDDATYTIYGDEAHTGEFYFAYQHTDWYALARESTGTVFTDAYYDSFGRGLTVTCVCPVYDGQGTFRGVVAADILIDSLSNSLIHTDISENSYAFLVNSSGDVIASKELTGEGTLPNIVSDKAHPAHKACGYILSGVSGVYLTSDNIYYAFSPIPASSWKVVLHIPEADIIKPITDIRNQISSSTQTTSDGIARNILLTMGIFLMTFVLVMLAVYIIARRLSAKLTRPLVALEQDVALISSGKLEHRSKVHTNDEIGQLARSFNNMTESLQEHITELTSVTAEKERIGAELDIAAHIQASMLPCIFPAFPERKEFEVYATMAPAKEVGGDFYDFFMVDEENLAIVMADVSGKGVPAALFMVIGKTLIKDHTQPGRDLGEVFTEVNNLLCEANSEGLFITVFEGVLNLRTGQFRYANAGHEIPFICKKGGVFEPYKIRAGFVLAGMEGICYKSGSLQLEPGDKIFQYTDGVTEATDNNSTLYGMERLGKKLDSLSCGTPHEILTGIKADIDRFVGEAPQFDDITMLCLEYKERMVKHERTDC